MIRKKHQGSKTVCAPLDSNILVQCYVHLVEMHLFILALSIKDIGRAVDKALGSIYKEGSDGGI